MLDILLAALPQADGARQFKCILVFAVRREADTAVSPDFSRSTFKGLRSPEVADDFLNDK
jgi:hypothetical protein